MTSPTAWKELSVVVVVLAVAMVGVLWVQRPASNCAMPAEGQRALVLSRDIDREHLVTDIAAAARTADRYMRLTADPVQQRTRFADCHATLLQEIATLHHLAPEDVQAHAEGAP